MQRGRVKLTEPSALRALSRVDYSLEWGIFQHNIGLSYIRLFKLQLDPPSALDIIERAIDHIQSSFEVRDPETELQYWIASCRSLGEALIEKARCQTGVEGADSLRLAQTVLTGAVSKAPEREHPHQWAELQEQLARCATASAFGSRGSIGRRPAEGMRLPAGHVGLAASLTG